MVMKYIFSLVLVSLLYSFSSQKAKSIYSLSIKSIDDKKISISSFRGKKMLFVVVPVTAQDSLLDLKSLKELLSKYDTSIIAIGIPAVEFGYQKSMDREIRKLYQKMPANFILAGGMNVRKSSAEQQDSLFQWLTKRENNFHFEQEVINPGQKFFVDEQGSLYGVLGYHVPFSNPVMDRILSKPAKNKPVVSPGNSSKNKTHSI
jgi:glutathione peroxidase